MGTSIASGNTPAKKSTNALSIITEEAESHGMNASFVLFNLLPSTSISFVMHMLLVMLLAFLVIPPPMLQGRTELTLANRDDELEQIETFMEDLPREIDVESTTHRDDSSSSSAAAGTLTTLVEPQSIASVDSPTVEENFFSANMDSFEIGEAGPPIKKFSATLSSRSGCLSIRKPTGPDGVHRGVGITDASEKAAAMGLKWLVEHQNADGSWNFDHARERCNRRCSQEGTLTNCTTGATAMALLPLLGAGQTHREGRYKEAVKQGLYYLLNRMKVNDNRGDLSEGTLYAHGIASIVLCEGYAMTHDKSLLAPAQLSLNYIAYAQDPVGGGWRYQPRQPGDTSAVGWQLMALKSGHMAYLQVNPNTIQGAKRFLDSVQGDSGATYGYTDAGNGPATSAVGLLSRMYLGWAKEHPALQRGIEQLAKKGPGKGQFYFNYYATQVMRHNGGEQWTKWNETMRESLIDSQETKDHAAGSWYERGDHGAEVGGRLYCTSLATMILEVYYRHLPMYKPQAADGDFPL